MATNISVGRYRLDGAGGEYNSTYSGKTKSIISYHPQDLFLWSLCHDICEIGGSPLGDMKLNVLVGHSGQQFFVTEQKERLFI
jgi:hypothetical protein